MKIAQVAPLSESVPPHRYGGTERVVSYLTEHPDLPAIAQPLIYSSRSLELLPAIAPNLDHIERCLAPAGGGCI